VKFLTFDISQISKLQYAAEGEISKPNSSGVDMGETVYSAARKYKHVLINQFGDWSRNNKSPEASQILHWLSATRYRIRL